MSDLSFSQAILSVLTIVASVTAALGVPIITGRFYAKHKKEIDVSDPEKMSNAAVQYSQLAADVGNRLRETSHQLVEANNQIRLLKDEIEELKNEVKRQGEAMKYLEDENKRLRAERDEAIQKVKHYAAANKSLIEERKNHDSTK